jgi:hypothetical protein
VASVPSGTVNALRFITKNVVGIFIAKHVSVPATPGVGLPLPRAARRASTVFGGDRRRAAPKGRAPASGGSTSGGGGIRARSGAAGEAKATRKTSSFMRGPGGPGGGGGIRARKRAKRAEGSATDLLIQTGPEGPGGGGGIRTHGTLASTPVFKTGAFNRSATPPWSGRYVARFCCPADKQGWLVRGNTALSGGGSLGLVVGARRRPGRRS